MKFRKQGIIHKPVGTVYNKYIENFGSEFLFNSSLSESKISRVGKDKGGETYQRSLKFKGTDYYIVEEITRKFRNANIEIALVETNMPIKSYKKVFSFSTPERNITEISYALSYDVKFSLMSLLKKDDSMDKVLCHENVIKEFKSYIEKGTVINKDAIIYN